MSDLNIRETLLELLTDWGVSGYEGNITARFRKALSYFTDDIRVDKLGNLIATVKGEGPEPRPKVMLAAHMDEIGLMVTKIEAQGFLRVTAVGGVDPRTQMAQEVVVHGRDGDYVGIFGSMPPHLTSPSERGKSAPLEDMFIDLAMPEERVREKVRVGDLVTIRRTPLELPFDRISGKSLDNRASMTATLECLQELKRLHHQADVIVVGTVQEERGRLGAWTSMFGIEPDIGIAIDVTFGDMPGAPDDASFPLDGGPCIFWGPNISLKVARSMFDVAKRLNMPVQKELGQRESGTDVDSMQLTGAGYPTGLVSIPVRYMHTSVETVCYRDIERTGQLLAHTIAGVDRAYVEGLTCFLKD
ncbi:MAG TPA: M42 family peptidase [Bacilli bacterium]|nr:M42 family peptidase [Bacilli bacterium]